MHSIAHIQSYHTISPHLSTLLLLPNSPPRNWQPSLLQRKLNNLPPTHFLLLIHHRHPLRRKLHVWNVQYALLLAILHDLLEELLGFGFRGDEELGVEVGEVADVHKGGVGDAEASELGEAFYELGNISTFVKGKL